MRRLRIRGADDADSMRLRQEVPACLIVRRGSMATMYLSRGTVGAGSTDAGRPQTLPLMERRLRELGMRVRYMGRQPAPISPPGRWLLYTVIEVGPEDEPVGMFDKRGFYFVAGPRRPNKGMIAISSQSPGAGVRAWETSLELREFCGNQSCSVVLVSPPASPSLRARACRRRGRGDPLRQRGG